MLKSEVRISPIQDKGCVGAGMKPKNLGWFICTRWVKMDVASWITDSIDWGPSGRAY